MNEIVGRDVLLSYPNFIKEYIIYTYARKTKLREVIIKHGNPVSFYSRKLTFK